jgi:predicted small metal-binding protein
MAYSFACQDIGVTCPFVAKGETIDEVVAEASKHAKEAHGYTDEQLKDPKLIEEVKAAIKKV